LAGDQRSLAAWFNTSAFVQSAPFTAGTAPRFSFYGPGIENWDTSLMRNFPIRERFRLEFRGEFYNSFNHPNFKNPNTTPGNINYGRITSANGPRNMELALRLFF
jgi:hypothetical protein